jgi:hypothetical protein
MCEANPNMADWRPGNRPSYRPKPSIRRPSRYRESGCRTWTLAMQSARVNTAQNRVSGVVVGTVDTWGAWGEGEAAGLDGFPSFTAPAACPQRWCKSWGWWIASFVQASHIELSGNVRRISERPGRPNCPRHPQHPLAPDSTDRGGEDFPQISALGGWQKHPHRGVVFVSRAQGSKPCGDACGEAA